jgi:ABC-type histidine transport system ATPase subunit
MGHLTGEQKYFDKMWDMYEFSRNQLAGKGMFNLADGQILESGTPEEFFGNPKNPRLKEFLSKVLS